MKPTNFELRARKYHAIAKAKGVKFRRRDLRRLRFAGENTFNGVLGNFLTVDIDLDAAGDLIVTNPLLAAMMAPRQNWLLSAIPKDEVWTAQPCLVPFEY